MFGYYCCCCCSYSLVKLRLAHKLLLDIYELAMVRKSYSSIDLARSNENIFYLMSFQVNLSFSLNAKSPYKQVIVKDDTVMSLQIKSDLKFSHEHLMSSKY